MKKKQTSVIIQMLRTLKKTTRQSMLVIMLAVFTFSSAIYSNQAKAVGVVLLPFCIAVTTDGSQCELPGIANYFEMHSFVEALVKIILLPFAILNENSTAVIDKNVMLVQGYTQNEINRYSEDLQKMQPALRSLVNDSKDAKQLQAAVVDHVRNGDYSEVTKQILQVE